MKPLSKALPIALAGALALPAGASAYDPNPCIDPAQAAKLLCPDLKMSPPYNIYLDRKSWRHHKLLRSANSINSVGDGPVEIRGFRSGARRMDAFQHIYNLDGGHVTLDTGAQLRFHYVPRFGGWYWKFNHTAQFELWRLNGLGVRIRRVRSGAKTIYCLRDLARTFPDLGGSPSQRHYPACSQDQRKQAVTLGTSVGWSDVYPANYYEQWIDVTGLKPGCYAYVHIADPDNRIYESSEDNNTSQRAVRLPFRGGTGGCKSVPDGATLPEPLPDELPTLPGY